MKSENIQPCNKSLSNYVSEGYCFATGKPLDNNLDSFDDGVLILDDIIDNSKERNGKSCSYISQGLEQTIISGIEQITCASLELHNLMKDTIPEFKYKALFALQKLTASIYSGEQMDKKVKTIPDYFNMITAFTGEHIAKGIEIGYYIANIDPNKELLEACKCAGRIRQIVDDYEDYGFEHHEPFGDFKKHKNRLPELLFTGNRIYALALIRLGQTKNARKYILSNEVKEKLFYYCLNEEKKIEQLDDRALKFVVPYNKLLG
jgi:geranylgeranyl pyrophosphate synthase